MKQFCRCTIDVGCVSRSASREQLQILLPGAAARRLRETMGKEDVSKLCNHLGLV